MTNERDIFVQSLDEMGEQQVRRILSRGAWNARRTKWAEEWLQELDDTREARSQRESLNIAKSAKNAAWAAAISAIIAIPIAIGAAVISYLAWTSPHPPH